MFAHPLFAIDRCCRALVVLTLILLRTASEVAAAEGQIDRSPRAAEGANRALEAGDLTMLDSAWDRLPEILSRIVPPEFPRREFLITDFGAVAGGVQKCTESFAEAIAACERAGGGRVVVPKGVFLTGAIHLRSNVELHLSTGAEIKFSDRFDDYLPVVFVRVGGNELYNYSPLIYARNCTNVAITGSGKLNGNAKAWWDWKDRETRRGFEMAAAGVPVEERVFGTPEAAIRPSFVSFVECTNVLLEDFTIGSGPNWTIHPVYCRNVTIRRVNVVTDGPNNDGIDPDSCQDVLIEGCTFDTGDDCVVLKSGYNEDGRRVGRPTENVIMRNCTSKRGHGGLVIGSEMSGDVRNVYVEKCDFDGTDRAIRIKSRIGRGGVVENVYVRDLIVRNLRHEVVLMNMDYSADRRAVRDPQLPVFRNILIEDIVGDGAPMAALIVGLDGSPIRSVTFRNFAVKSSQGIVAKHARELRFERVDLCVERSPAFLFENVADVEIRESGTSPGLDVFLEVRGDDSQRIAVKNCNLTEIDRPVVVETQELSDVVDVK